uniref:(northern house mosquito) hypothetical protein n=1 Tax=Culex pipiens TaxID=7175 RepID=A0A8D8GCS6_CULPI
MTRYCSDLPNFRAAAKQSSPNSFSSCLIIEVSATRRYIRFDWLIVLSSRDSWLLLVWGMNTMLLLRRTISSQRLHTTERRIRSRTGSWSRMCQITSVGKSLICLLATVIVFREIYNSMPYNTIPTADRLHNTCFALKNIHNFTPKFHLKAATLSKQNTT